MKIHNGGISTLAVSGLVRGVTLALLLALMLAGCEKPPQAEIDAAAAAVSIAEADQNALTYGSAALERAKTALSQAYLSVENKRYDEAKTFADETVAAAERAVEDGKIGLARRIAEVEGVIGKAQTELETAEAAVEAAALKAPSPDIQAHRVSLQEVRGILVSSQEDLTAQRFQDASSKAESVRSAAAAVVSALSSNASAFSKKKK
jgi:hypothetical protein